MGLRHTTQQDEGDHIPFLFTSHLAAHTNYSLVTTVYNSSRLADDRGSQDLQRFSELSVCSNADF